jgi:hypothetical protein
VARQSPLLAKDPDLYYSLLRQVAKFVEPEGIIEWLWLKDVVDLSWEIQRLRRFKTDFFEVEGSRRFEGWSDADTELVTIVFRDGLDYYERADKLVASLELRRNAVLREIEIRRDSLARRIRKIPCACRESTSRRVRSGMTSERKIAANRRNASRSTGAQNRCHNVERSDDLG